MGQNRVLDNFAPEFSSSLTYSVGDLVMYCGTLYVCSTAITTAGSWTGVTNWTQTNLAGTASKLTVNPVLTGLEPELLGLVIGQTTYQAQKLFQTDGVSFDLNEDADYTLTNSYSSYCRVGKTTFFVISFDITKNANVNSPITVGTFSNIPLAISNKLVGGIFLDQDTVFAYEDGTYDGVEVVTAVTKGNDNSISVSMDTSSLVQGTTYHIRFLTVFLLTDNLIVDPILDNNDWATIARICEAGTASSFWNVGDTKTDLGTDGVTRTFRIADMSGLYGKHVVFEQMNLEGTDGTGATGVVWDADNLNDYLASDMNVTVLPSVITRYSSSLQGTLTNTTVKVAENGNSATIVDVTNKLFLEAEKEVGYTSYSRTEEQAVLTTYAYWSTHTSANDHIKYNQANSARHWWLRSPYSGYTGYVCYVDVYGVASYYDAYYTLRFAPCFSF